MAAGARYSHLPLSWHKQPACGPASTEPKVQKARPLRVHLSTRGSEQPFELQPAMKAMSRLGGGSVLPTWVGHAWRVGIFKWAAIGQWSSGRARWAASRPGWALWAWHAAAHLAHARRPSAAALHERVEHPGAGRSPGAASKNNRERHPGNGTQVIEHGHREERRRGRERRLETVAITGRSGRTVVPFTLPLTRFTGRTREGRSNPDCDGPGRAEGKMFSRRTTSRHDRSVMRRAGQHCPTHDTDKFTSGNIIVRLHPDHLCSVTVALPCNRSRRW